jgi:hypothetical protein
MSATPAVHFVCSHRLQVMAIPRHIVFTTNVQHRCKALSRGWLFVICVILFSLLPLQHLPLLASKREGTGRRIRSDLFLLHAKKTSVLTCSETRLERCAESSRSGRPEAFSSPHSACNSRQTTFPGQTAAPVMFACDA